MGSSTSNSTGQVALDIKQFRTKSQIKLLACNTKRGYFLTIDDNLKLSIQRLSNGKVVKTFLNFRRQKQNIHQERNALYQQQFIGIDLSQVWQSKKALFITTKSNKIIRNCQAIHKLQTKSTLDLIFISQQKYFIWDPFTGEFQLIGNLVHKNEYTIGLTPNRKQVVQVWVYYSSDGESSSYIYYARIHDIHNKQIKHKNDDTQNTNAQNMRIIVSPNSKFFISIESGEKTLLSIWHFDSLNQARWSHRSGKFLNCSFSEDSELVMVIKQQKINIYRSLNGQKVYTLQQSNKSVQQLISFTFPNKIKMLQLNHNDH